MITSAQNNGYKDLLRMLSKHHYRRERGLVLVEGAKENELALRNGLELQALYLSGTETARPEGIDPAVMVPILPALFQKLVYRPQSSMLGAYRAPQSGLEMIQLSANPLLLILEAVEKPGNLGAVLRTADGVGADAVILCDAKTDIYNPNVIRSSVGTIFAVQTAAATAATVLDWCRDHRLNICAAALEGAEPYTTVDLRQPSAIVFGTEAQGLSPFWLGHADAIIKIPMLGMNDSLNVSNSVAVIAYEALRQRSRAGM